MRAFHAIAIEGGISRAARRLNVSQPTLSQQLKALEARYCVTLFESRKSPLSLTTAGKELFALTQKLLAAAADIDDMLGETAGLTSGMLRLGSDSPFYAAKMIELFRQRYPQMKVQVRMGNAREVVRWLGDAQIDAALASDPVADSSFSYELLGEERLSCALPTDHALCALDVVPIAALANETVLLREPTSKTRMFADRAMAEAGIEPRTIVELQSRETIREAIALSLGVSVFFTSECPPDARIVYRPLDTEGRDYVLMSYLVCQTERRRSALMRALLSIATEVQRSDMPAVGRHERPVAHDATVSIMPRYEFSGATETPICLPASS